MKISVFFLVAIVSIPVWSLQNFITRDGHRLMDGNVEFRFAGIHAPELHRIEDDARGLCDADTRGWGQYFKWPTADEQENWIKSYTRIGQKAMRITVLSIEQKYDKLCERETHVLAPLKQNTMPRLHEGAMRHYDRMIALADKYNLRLILPFIDHWEWWGGRKQLAAFYGEQASDFYDIKSKTYAAYLNIIQQLITRKNTYTGRLYRDEKAILAWETGNELYETNKAFLNSTTAFIKSLDSNHLVMDGNYRKIHQYALEDPNVDIISNHLYANVGNLNPAVVLNDLKTIKGQKAYVIGEFGLLDAPLLRDIMQEVVGRTYNGARTVGAFIWGGRGHRHEGGYYWHNEPANRDIWSYHLPGFKEGEANQEIEVINIVREAIAQIEGRRGFVPLPIPEAPTLRVIFDPKRINWMGAPTGRSYRVERAYTPEGPWKTIAQDVRDGKNKYDPYVDSLFSDPVSTKPGETYYYRIFAQNESGESPPSNVRSYTAY